MVTDRIETIQGALALIEDPARWTRGASARTEQGRATDPSSPLACQWCAAGALTRVGRTRGMTADDNNFDAWVEIDDALDASVSELYPARDNYIRVNDELGHEAVIRVFRATLARLTT